MSPIVKAGEIEMDGYTVLPSLISNDIVSALRTIAEERRIDGNLYIFGSELFVTHPELVFPIVGDPKVLDLAEKIVGPFVQLDSFSLVGVAVGCPASVSWHEDPYAGVPRGEDFQKPLAMNLLIYLQDLNDDVGPLRVIPGSHRKSIVMDQTERSRPYPHERLLYLKAGDAVLIHNSLVHSRSQNTSETDRIHISVVYTLSCMRSTLDFQRAPFRQIVHELQRSHNRRLLRLFGEDPSATSRYNSGFLQKEDAMWAEWILEDANPKERSAK